MRSPKAPLAIFRILLELKSLNKTWFMVENRCYHHDSTSLVFKCENCLWMQDVFDRSAALKTRRRGGGVTKSFILLDFPKLRELFALSQADFVFVGKFAQKIWTLQEYIV